MAHTFMHHLGREYDILASDHRQAGKLSFHPVLAIYNFQVYPTLLNGLFLKQEKETISFVCFIPPALALALKIAWTSFQRFMLYSLF